MRSREVSVSCRSYGVLAIPYGAFEPRSSVRLPTFQAQRVETLTARSAEEERFRFPTQSASALYQNIPS